jgi:8-oxo-dGTP diphosphatase
MSPSWCSRPSSPRIATRLVAEVVLAVVTSPRGVLLIERADRTPPLAFPGGKIEPCETLPAAAAREVFEETGVTIRCTRLLGKRVHPATGATITYIAALPPSTNTAPNEVMAASWSTISDALARLGTELYQPVRSYLEHARLDVE